MRAYFYIALLFILSIISVNFSYAQGVAINADGSTADASAMLDVKSTTKGMLVPRVTSTASVTSLSNGLLVYQTNAPVGFYYYNGSAWIYLQNTGAVNGILKGNGTTVSAAVAGTDYLTPAGNAATATLASTVTTNANLTGDVTSSGNATSYNNVVPANKGGAGTVNGILQANGSGTVSAASTTGSGNVVLASSPTLVTPSLGTPSTLVGTNISGTAANLTAGKVTTNANLTGDVVSTGNATTYNNIVPIAKGGTGTGTTPSLVAGSNVTITGSWPNQTIAATSGGSSYVIPPTGSLHSLSKTVAIYWNPTTSVSGATNPIYTTDIMVPAACKPSMTVYSSADVAVTFSIYTATTTGGTTLTGAKATSLVSCTTAASSGTPTTCTATVTTAVATGTYLTIEAPATTGSTNTINAASLIFSCQ